MPSSAIIVYEPPVIPASDGVKLAIGSFTVTPTGLIANGTPTFGEWLNLGHTLRFMERSVQWALGDWLNYGERRWGEKYSQAVGQTDYEQSTLETYAWVARSVDCSIRVEELTFTHHRQVADLRLADKSPDTGKQQHYLQIARQENLSVSAFKQRIRRDERAAVLAAQKPVEVVADDNIVLGDCTEIEWTRDVDLIIADPPFGLSKGDSAGARDGKGEWDEWSYDDLHAFNANWLDRAVDALRPNGSLFVFGTLHNIFSIGHILRERGLYIIRDIVWSKPFVQRVVNPNALVPSHELILWARKGSRHTCNLNEITRDVWEFPTDAPYSHPAEKPAALIRALIDMATQPGDLVADPFLGSGVTAAVAKQLKRRYWGVERDEYWHAVATQRVRGA